MIYYICLVSNDSRNKSILAFGFRISVQLSYVARFEMEDSKKGERILSMTKFLIIKVSLKRKSHSSSDNYHEAPRVDTSVVRDRMPDIAIARENICRQKCCKCGGPPYFRGTVCKTRATLFHARLPLFKEYTCHSEIAVMN